MLNKKEKTTEDYVGLVVSYIDIKEKIEKFLPERMSNAKRLEVLKKVVDYLIERDKKEKEENNVDSIEKGDIIFSSDKKYAIFNKGDLFFNLYLLLPKEEKEKAIKNGYWFFKIK